MLVLLGLKMLWQWRGPWGTRSGCTLSLLGLLLLAAVLRGAATSERIQERGSPFEREGRLSVLRSFGSSSLATLGGLPEPLEFPTGLVGRGERVRLVGIQHRVQKARGPEPGLDPDNPPQEGGPAPVLRYEVGPEDIVRVATVRSSPWGLALRRRVAAMRLHFAASLQGVSHQDARALARAILLGDRAHISADLADLFTRTGARHWLAFSGLHVALMAWLLARPLVSASMRLLGFPGGGILARSLEAGLVLLLVPLSGAGAPATRAAIAASLAIVAARVPDTQAHRAGWRIGRRVDGPTLPCLALALEALVRPASLSSVGLLLSYSATFGLVLAYGGVRRRLAACLPRGAKLSATGSTGHVRPERLRATGQRAIEAVVAGTAASVTALLATLPITWWVFGELAWSAIPAALFSFPLVAWLIGAGWLDILGAGWLPDALWISPTRLWLELLGWIDALPGTPLVLPTRPLWLLVLATIAGLVALTRPGAHSGAQAHPGAPRSSRLGLGAAGLLLFPWRPAAGRLEVHVLDVGHGTAVLIRIPGEACRLYDAGSADRPRLARDALAPLLRRWEVRDLDITLSHSDHDHASALPWIVRRWTPKSWSGALPEEVELSPGTPVVDVLQGATQRWRGQSKAAVWTLLRGSTEAGNEGSRALAVRWRGARVLLMGDTEERGLEGLLACEALTGPWDLLLAPHHGSDLDKLDPLLARTSPRRVWISANREPAIGPELDRRSIDWRSTAREGPLLLQLEGAAGTPRAGSRGRVHPLR